ncbi:hypothetical protein FACS1894102_6210 [Spirochaetia bacterium]|nr:hypothetical protein FACS1894102_6210 [Spirochaetia bacterium]
MAGNSGTEEKIVELEKAWKAKNDNMLHYKDHNIAEIKIEPSLYHTQTNADNMQPKDPINKISIDVLNGNVKPSNITDTTFYYCAIFVDSP